MPHLPIPSPSLVVSNLPRRFAARVQGADQPFYATSEEGEVFSLDQSHFCRAIATGERSWVTTCCSCWAAATGG